jgi:xanthine dehydrogenase molybdenum-binding subunit
MMAEHAYNLEVVKDDVLKQGVVRVKGYPVKMMTIGEITRQAQIMSWGTIAYTDSYRQRNCPPCFTTHFVEAEVDLRTGVISIPRVLIYGDCGTAVNPDMVKGQLIGSFNRGFGYTVYERLEYDERGLLDNHGLMTDYKLPSFTEMPYPENIEVRICHTYEPSGPFGAKGIGEAALASVQAAIANAVYNAIGIRFYKLPITPEAVLKALKEKAREVK